MTLKRRVTTALLAGAVATSVIAPSSVFAASQGEVDVNYVAGALIPDSGDGSYYVTVPASITFTAQNEVKDMDVSLHATDPTAALSSTLSVGIKVYSQNNYSLRSTTQGTSTGTYQLKYHLTNAANGTVLANQTPGSGTPADDATDLIASETLTATNDLFEGQAQLTVAPNDAVPSGTTYSDTLTYFVSEISK